MAFNPVISISAEISGSSIAFRILHQDESLREVSGDAPLFVSSQGLEIRCYEFPEIHDHAIYLRGSIRERDDIFFVSYPWKHEVNSFLEKVILSILEFVEHKFQSKFTIFVDGNKYNFVETWISHVFTTE